MCENFAVQICQAGFQEYVFFEKNNCTECLYIDRKLIYTLEKLSVLGL